MAGIRYDPGGAGTFNSLMQRILRREGTAGCVRGHQLATHLEIKMRTEALIETISLDEINRTLDLARERDPSIETEPGYSDGSQSEPRLSAGNHASNLSILAAAALFRGRRRATRSGVATELYKHVQQLARQY